MLFRTSASVIALVACSSFAVAADFGGPSGSLKDGYAAPAAHNWSGAYIGLNVGHAWGDFKINESSIVIIDQEDPVPDPYEDPDLGSAKFSPDGWFGGGQVGFNVQTGRFVFGLEADLQAGDMTDGVHIGGKIDGLPGDLAQLDGADITAHFGVDVRYFGSLRGRLGLAMDRVMPYITGGLAWANVDMSSSFTVTYDEDEFSAASSDANTHMGWVLGGGIEVALDERWSLKGEYLYWDLGKETYTFDYATKILGSGEELTTVTGEADLTFQTFRVGVNYKFGG